MSQPAHFLCTKHLPRRPGRPRQRMLFMVAWAEWFERAWFGVPVSDYAAWADLGERVTRIGAGGFDVSQWVV